MNATSIRVRRQTTLPEDVCRAAGLKIHDQIDWRFEDGEIRGRKLVREEIEVLGVEDVDPKTLLPKDGRTFTQESINRAIRQDRDSR